MSGRFKEVGTCDWCGRTARRERLLSGGWVIVPMRLEVQPNGSLAPALLLCAYTDARGDGVYGIVDGCGAVALVEDGLRGAAR